MRLAGGRVVEMGRGLVHRRRERVLDLAHHLALPGLVNGHDHLGLDLFPPLGSPPYRSFYEWAEEIYRPAEPPLRDLLRVELADRLWWGGYRNLISGVTTVVHHDSYERRVFRRSFPVRVLAEYGWAHSLGFATDIEQRHRRSGRHPFIVHAAEGTDARAAGEIDELMERGLLRPRTVVVHGMAISDSQLDAMAAAGTGVVWCPSSNLRLYESTADVTGLRERLCVCLGTDSTLCGAATLLEELRIAREEAGLEAEDLLRMVTTEAASVFDLEAAGGLEEGGPADLVVLPDRGRAAAEVLLATRCREIVLVFVNGEPNLAGESMAGRLDLGAANLRLDGVPKWVCGEPLSLRDRIAAVVREDILGENPLWPRLVPIQ